MASASSLFFALLLLSVCGNPIQRMVAEWEPAYGTLIRWPLGIPVNLVVHLSQEDEVFVLTNGPNEEAEALSVFKDAGVVIDRVRFVDHESYSHWTRDWGPQGMFNQDGLMEIVDPEFAGYPWVPGCEADKSNLTEYDVLEKQAYVFSHGHGPTLEKSQERGWEKDNQAPESVARHLGLPVRKIKPFLTGGNIMYDGYGTAISTRQMIAENFPRLSEQEFLELAKRELGITRYIIVDNPEVYGIQHIDCYAKYLDSSTILVKQVEKTHPEYACTEALAETLGKYTSLPSGEKYKIIRIFAESYDAGTCSAALEGGDAANDEKALLECALGNDVPAAAYTNSLILNRNVYVPMFGLESDEKALETYRNAMPGYKVMGFGHDQKRPWYHYDALHCRTMGLFKKASLRAHATALLLERGHSLPESQQDAMKREPLLQTPFVVNDINLAIQVKGQVEVFGVPVDSVNRIQSFLYWRVVCGDNNGSQYSEWITTSVPVESAKDQASHYWFGTVNVELKDETHNFKAIMLQAGCTDEDNAVWEFFLQASLRTPQSNVSWNKDKQSGIVAVSTTFPYGAPEAVLSVPWLKK